MASTDRRLHWMNVLFPDDIDFPGNTDGIIVPSGLTAERPVSPVNGFIRYNTTTKVIEGYVDGAWVELGSTGSGGVATFTDLSDTPNSYLTHANKLLRVNIGTTGVEFVDGNTLFLPLAGGTMNTGANITMSGATITGVPSPQFNNDVANKEYVDGIAAGLAVKESVHSATTANINLATQALAGIDGHATYTDGDRVLVKDQTIPSENGIYAAHAGPWTRTTDMDGTPANEVQGGTTTYVQDGTANGDTNWVVIWDGNVDVGTDPMNWSLIAAGSSQNLWETIQDDSSGTISATGPTDTLIVAGGTGISTAVSGSTLTITNDAPNIAQNVFGTITGNLGTSLGTPAGTTLAIKGDGVTVSTAITNSPEELIISVIGGPLASRLQDSDNNTFIDLEFAAPDTNNIRIETGSNPGTAGGNIDIITSVGTVGKRGGDFSVTGGDGGLFSTTPGDGGTISLFGGDGGGGNLTTETGGAGGNIEISGGAGGTAFNAGNGGDVIIVPGAVGAGAVGVDGDVVLGLASHIWPNTDGGANDVLTTDGAGNLSFTAAAGGSSSRINDTDDNTYVETEQGADDNSIRFGFESSTNKVGGEIANWSQSGINIGNYSGGTGLDGNDGLGFFGSGTSINIVSGFGGSSDGIQPGSNGGNLDLRAGKGGGANYSPDINAGNGGYVNLFGGNGGNYNGFYGSDGDGGEVRIHAGNGDGSGTGGRIELYAGGGGSGDFSATGGAGGPVLIKSGKGFVNQGGGGITIESGYGGNTGSASGGEITIASGDSQATGIVGPDVIIHTGRGGSTVSGNIVLAPGFGSGQGAVTITSKAGYGSSSTELRFQEAPTNGTNLVALKAPASIASDQVWILPDAGQTSPQVLGTDLGEFTIANLPAAGTYPNCWALATDASGGRTIVRSDGTNWKVVAVEGATVA